MEREQPIFGEIADSLRKWREGVPFSPTQLATQLRMRQVKQIGEWERGIAIPGRHYIQELCRIYHCNARELFAGPHATRDPYSIDQQAILEREEGLGPKGEVFIVTGTEEFLEAIDDGFLAGVIKCIDNGTRYTYFYPMPATAPHSPGSASYHEVRTRITERVGVLASSFVRGFAYDCTIFSAPSNPSLFVLLFQDGALLDVFQFVTCAALDSNTTPTKRRWLRIPMEDAKGLAYCLTRATVPVQDAGLHLNRIESNVQKDYRTLFGDERFLRNYRSLRSLIDYCTADMQLLRRTLMDCARATDRGYISILEIGPGDFSMSNRVLYTPLREHHMDFHVTGVDPSSIPERSTHKRNCNAVHSQYAFEEWPLPEARFDLILSLHSMYLIDPNNIARMFFLLREDGRIAILHSPLAGNVLNTLAHFIDSARGSELIPYEGKQVTTDPYRVFAEDLLSWLKTNSCPIDTALDLNPMVNMRLLLSETAGRLSPMGTQVVEYFAGRVAADTVRSDAWERQCVSHLQERFGSDSHPSKEVLFILRRPRGGTWLLRRR